MKRLLLFLLLASAGSAALLEFGGGLEGPLRSMPEAIVEERTEPLEDGPKIELGAGSPDVDAIEGITQPAPPRRIVWEDPLSDERVEIPTFVPWRFQARDARPLPTPSGERQGVLSRDVHFQMFRKPATRAEAVALARNEPDAYAALLHQDFTAKEARVYGRLGEALSQKHATQGSSAGLGDTELRLTRDVVLVDRSQGIEIRGGDMRIWPEQDRAEGDGHFTLTHSAMVLSGKGLVMERDDARGWSRVSMKANPVLRIVSEGRGKDGKPIFDFGPGEFRPATVASSGRAVLVRQEGRSETVITVTFRDDVRAVQQGGRTLSAGRAELVAVKAGPAAIRRGDSWRLQRFDAGKAVKLDYPGRTKDGAEYLTSISADRLSHDVPDAGAPAQTVLEGNVTILLRGEIALLGPGGRLHLSCRDRAWIGPLPAGAPDGGLDRATLQQIGLRGGARIEREIPGPSGERDALEADALDLVVQPQRGSEQAGALEPQTRMLAVHFAALGDVLVSGKRIRGATHRLVGDDLHTEHPHVTAEGKGTWFDFPDLASDQRLLGPDPAPRGAGAEEPGGTRTARGDEPEGRWVLQRLRARGAVDITTSVGGPALGIPAHLEGEEVSYDRVSRRARLVGAPARMASSASRTQTNTVAAREITLDRSGGRITATGGVKGELYVPSRGSGGSRFGWSEPGGRQNLDGATLSVRTDERIDIRMLRGDTRSWKPAPGKEQVIRIAGPVSTELRAADNSVDRMRSESLEVALVFQPPAVETPTDATAPAARAAPDRSGRERRTPQRPADVVLERLDVDARTVRVDMQAGDVSFLEATGAVDLRGRSGHVRGERLTYEAGAERIQVTGTAKRHAVAFLGDSEQRSEVRAMRLELQLEDGEPIRLEAHAPTGGTSEVQLYRDVRSKPGQLEWFAVTYAGTAVITQDLLRAGRVRVIRRLRQPGERAWGNAAVLRSPTLRVLGRQLLSTDDKARDIREIIAEGLRGGAEGDVHFVSGTGAKQLQIWGQRFDFDVVKREAQLTGLPGRDVTMQRGGGLHARYIRVTIDMRTNLPTAEGSRILWRPRANR